MTAIAQTVLRIMVIVMEDGITLTITWRVVNLVAIKEAAAEIKLNI